MSLRIVQYNEPILRAKGSKVTEFDTGLARLAQDMITAMHEASGIGLAAQQVGRALQFFVVDLRQAEVEFNWELDGARPPLDLFMPLAIANPQLVIHSVPPTPYEEGCLSFPGIRANIDRSESVTLKFQDERGIPHLLTCDGLLARCLQHEVDHVNGVLFIDRMDKKTRASIDEAVKTLGRETRLADKK
jgi:peptide deformylase